MQNVFARMEQLSFKKEANTMTQVYNFSAGPAMMPKAVLEQAQKELLNWQGQGTCLLYTSPSPRDGLLSRMPSSA